MRALFITRKWPPAVGGMETYCYELAAEIGRHADLDVRMLPGKPDGQRPGGVAVLGFCIRMLLLLALAGRRYATIHAS